MTTEEEIGQRPPHRCYHYKYLATHTLPKTIKVMIVSIAINIYFVYDFLMSFVK